MHPTGAAAFGAKMVAKLAERQRTSHVRSQTKRMADGAFSLERLVCDPEMGKLPASPAQRALMRAADGLQVDLPETGMLFHFNTRTLPQRRARVIIVRAGVRGGKSLMAVLALLRSILTCNFRRKPEPDEEPGPDGLVGVRPRELVRAVILGPTLEHTKVSFDHLVGTMRESPILSTMLVRPLTNSCWIRRPDGIEVVVQRVAAGTGGAGLRSTWLAGVLFDEADFHGGGEAVVNLEQQLQAARARMLQGAQIWVVSSPWSDASYFHELFTKAHGNPSEDIVAFHSDSRSLNPSLSRADEAAERKRDPENAAREYDAIPIPAGTSRFFPEDCILKSINANRPMHLPPNGQRHYAGADWGFSKNSSALAISFYDAAIRRVRLAYHEELRPTKEESLRIGATVAHFFALGMSYATRTIRGDHYLSPQREHARVDFVATFHDTHDKGRVPTYEEWDPNRDAQTELFTEFRRRMQEGLVEIPDDLRLLTQLRAITSRPMPGGAVKIVLPKQGTAHGDLALAVALAVVAAPCVEHTPAPPRAPVKTSRYGDYASDERRHSGDRGFG